MNRQQALRTLAHPVATERAAAVARLADLGQPADAARVAERLRDDDEDVRTLASSALWMIWSRSGDRQIDRLFSRGMQQMSAGDLDAALATFSRVVQKKPAFAEGWNKRATVRFMLGDDAASLKDCEETLKRNPMHFGALSGMAHIHLRRGDAELALQAYTRALQANPNLEDGPEMLQLLEDAVRRQGGQRT
jgi:tetratricopeptide (TPR) repeat protein